MSNASKLEYSASPNAADGFQFDSGKPKSQRLDVIASSSTSVDSQSDEHDFQPKFWKSTSHFQEISQSAIDVQEKSRPSDQFQEKLRSADDFQEKSGSRDDVQDKSRPAIKFKEKSRPSDHFQEKPRPADDFLEKSRSRADVPEKSRPGKSNRPKSKMITSLTAAPSAAFAWWRRRKAQEFQEKSRSADYIQEISQSLAEVQEISRPIAEVQEISQSLAEVQEISRPIAEVQEISRPLAEVQEISRPIAQVQEISRPVANFQEISRPIAQVQEISQSRAEVQEISRPADDFQEKSRSAADVPEKSRAGKLNSRKPRMITSSSAESLYLSSDNEDDFKEKLHSFWYPATAKSTWVYKTKYHSTWSYETKFLFNVSLRLSDEQMYAFLANIKELYDGKRTVEETSKKAGEIFGTDNRDLFLSFLGLLISSQHPLPTPITTQMDGMQFFLQARRCLSVEQLHAFLSAMQPINSLLATEEETLSKVEEIFGTDNRDLFISFQGLLISSPREHSGGEELRPQLVSPNPSEHSDDGDKLSRRIFTILVLGESKRKETFRKVIETFGTDQFKSFRELLNPKIH